MKVSYDPRTDTLSMVLKEDAEVAESDEDKPGVILDYDEKGDLVSLEILDASRRVTDTRKIEFETIDSSSPLPP
jgi:uncharacterized protein YuzE